jgi:hypothetical protein
MALSKCPRKEPEQNARMKNSSGQIKKAKRHNSLIMSLNPSHKDYLPPASLTLLPSFEAFKAL